jgi:tetratricopeptide (TPR) repeat protein
VEPAVVRAAVLPRKRLIALLGGAAVAVAVASGLYLTLGSSGGKARLEAGYKNLEAGQLQEAAREFASAVSAKPAEAYEGLALVALRQNDPVSAQKFCVEAQKTDGRRPGCILVQGDAVALQGDLPKAAASYEAVISYAGVSGIPRSIAYSRLGRLAAEQGQPEQAQTAYTKAQQSDPRNWEAASNMGALLRRQGKYAEAAATLEKAAAINPNDPMVQTQLKDVRETEGASKDADKQRRVDALVDELAGRFKRGEVARPPAGRDEWTSPPLTISMLGLESRGRMAFREGEYDFMLLRIGQALEGQTRARLVDRAVMDKLLAELKLSSSALVDQRTALQLGRVLSARLITVGSVSGGATEWTLTLRVIETETSTVVASVAQSFPLAQSTTQAADVVAKDLAARLRKTFPLRARVVGGGAGEVVLNVGTGDGAAVGQKLLIFRESAGGQREMVGEAEISEVTDKQSRAKLPGDARSLPAGLKAIERS